MIEYTGKQYLMIDIGSHYGLDKELFETRIDWVEQNIHALEALVEQSKDPFRYAAAVMAFRQCEAGVPTGHLVGLDQCASGPQIMSALTGCPVGAANTGLTGKTRKDLYEKATGVMNGILPEQIYCPIDVVKMALMPHYYGSKAEPKKVFGEGKELDAFYEMEYIVAPGAHRMMNLAMDAWQPMALEHWWDLPDGFNAICRVKQLMETKVEVDTIEGHPSFMYQYKVNQGEIGGVSLVAK